MHDRMKRAEVITGVRESFAKLQMKCGECNTSQVQLVYIDVDFNMREHIGAYKCRECKHKFTVTMQVMTDG